MQDGVYPLSDKEYARQMDSNITPDLSVRWQVLSDWYKHIWMCNFTVDKRIAYLCRTSYKSQEVTDILDEAILKATQSVLNSTFRFKDVGFIPYVKVIAEHEFYSRCRRKIKETFIDDFEEFLGYKAVGKNLDYVDNEITFEQVIEPLSKRSQDILRLYAMGFKAPVVAQMLNMSPASVRQEKKRALDVLSRFWKQ